MIDPTNPVAGTSTAPWPRSTRDGRFHVHLDQRLQRQQRPRGDPATTPRQRYLHRRQRRQRRNPQPDGVIARRRHADHSRPLRARARQIPGAPTPVGSFNITQLGDKADKVGKDDNFRGLTIFDNVVYLTKGSGGNGVNTVYFVDTTGHACPNGVGVPAPGARLPTAPLAYDPTQLQTAGVCPATCASSAASRRPWPSQEQRRRSRSGSGSRTRTRFTSPTKATANTFDDRHGHYTDAARRPPRPAEVGVRHATGSWQLRVHAAGRTRTSASPTPSPAYPTGDNPRPACRGRRPPTGCATSPAASTATARATIWAITSTVSGNGDQGADPNKLVAITDVLANTNPPYGRRDFRTVRTAGFGEVLRGVSFTPGSGVNP